MHTDREKQNKAMTNILKHKRKPVNCFCSFLCYSSMIFNKIHEKSSLSYCTEYITAWIEKKK